jgi:hypothetical protein
MVNRVEGGGNLLLTSSFQEKLAGRIDIGRLAGSPVKAGAVALSILGRMARTRWYRLRHTPEPEALLRSLPL